MQRAQIYLTESHIGHIASVARARGTSQSALIREALDEYLARQAPVDKSALRSQAFASWSDNTEAPTLAELRSEDRHEERDF